MDVSAIWRRTLIEWNRPQPWASAISRWVRPYLNQQGIRYLQRIGEQDICWDDSNWLNLTQDVLDVDVQFVIEILSDTLSFATARTFHGCRTEDAGLYHREGIRLNDPAALSDQVRRIVREEKRLAHLRPTIEQRLREFDHSERDTGRLYVVMDDRGLTDGAGHYALYGSEWILCVLGFESHAALRGRGVPTILAVDLPLSMVTSHEREQLAEALLQEWTRIEVNRPDFVPELDFTFCLSRNLPGDMIVGHTHPAVISDPFYQNIKRRSAVRTCPACGG